MSIGSKVDIVLHPIGYVRSAFDATADPKEIRKSISQIEIDPMYGEALDGLERFQYIIVIFHMDRSPGYSPRVHPMGDPSLPKRGVLSTRSPARPNQIGLSLTRLISIDGTTLRVTGLDAIEGTPVLDIKPYEEYFDSPSGIERESAPPPRN